MPETIFPFFRQWHAKIIHLPFRSVEYCADIENRVKNRLRDLKIFLGLNVVRNLLFDQLRMDFTKKNEEDSVCSKKIIRQCNTKPIWNRIIKITG